MNAARAVNGIPTTEFLVFLKGKIPVIHNSNVFFRDIEYGVMAWLEAKGSPVGHTEAERTARALAERLQAEGIFTRIDHQSWRVNYPQFALPRVEKPAAAPAAAPPAQPAAPARPAAAAGAPGQ